MTRTERLEFCRKCTNRKIDSQQRILCGLTDKFADFEGNCSNFKQDSTATEIIVENEELRGDEVVQELNEQALKKLRLHQDFYYALIGGLIAVLISAVIWAVITVATEYQIGYMALAVGLLVGFTVRFFGAGIDKKFGYLGAVLSLLGCLLGNLLSQVGFIAQYQSLGYFETITYLDFSTILSIYKDSFSPMDLLFYGIAVYEGYRFAFRKITSEAIARLKSGDYDGHPANSKLRLPLVIGSIVVLSIILFKVSRGVSGFKTYRYESGNIMSEGELKNSKEHGKWTYYHENGNKQSTGYYIDGIPDSSWQWFNEAGKLIRDGKYKNGLESGTWINYYDNGIVSDSGNYLDSRTHGFWIYRYENGNIAQSGYYNKNAQDSVWNIFYENGKLKATGSIKEGKMDGEWTFYFDNGQLSESIVYESGGSVLIKNTFDIYGKKLVVDGNGIYKSFSPTGQVVQAGKVENGLKVGKWIQYHDNGKIREEGKFENDRYQMLNSWDINEKQIITDGFGTYISYFPNGTSISEMGEIKNGYKNGLWQMYFESNGNVNQELLYVDGKMEGHQKFYFESGNLYLEGLMKNDLKEGEWKWYYENGNLSSTVSYVNDKKEGTQILWSEAGEKVKVEEYKNGELMEEITL